MSWDERLQRQQDLARGVDADLVRDQDRHWRLGWLLLAASLVLGLVSRLHLPGILRSIILGLAAVFLLLGFPLAAWARWERVFLSKPDPEEPPSILK